MGDDAVTATKPPSKPFVATYGSNLSRASKEQPVNKGAAVPTTIARRETLDAHLTAKYTIS